MYPKNDPRSFEYERIYNKTKINKKKLILLTSLNIIINILLFNYSKQLYEIIIANLIYFICCLKYIIIFIIKLYQKFAPISVRSKCRFEPSCSNYMLISLEKYGLIKGLKLGMKRLKRCNINGGGFDYP